MSGDSEKIFHRSLDLLQIWITDCRVVDFTPKSSLVDMVENFVNAEVLFPGVTILYCIYYNIADCLVCLSEHVSVPTTL